MADEYHFIAVYPNAIASSWSVEATTDNDFISNLIDTIRSCYQSNSSLLFNGISDGGFMTYKLGCALPVRITAIALISGTMSQFLENTCVAQNGLPVMHFHSTSDPIVNYNGAPDIQNGQAQMTRKTNKDFHNPHKISGKILIIQKIFLFFGSKVVWFSGLGEIIL